MITALLLLALAEPPAPAPMPADCPMHAQHMAEKSGAITDAHHGAKVDARHDDFGFSHDASRHSFRLFEDGGAIELHAAKEDDTATITAIRAHLTDIAKAFAKGDFAMPHFVHGHTPDGVDSLAKLHDVIEWKFEELPDGARVRMRSANPEALRAIHAFQRFQIAEHRTGEKGDVERE
jgi:hypothetical protein